MVLDLFILGKILAYMNLSHISHSRFLTFLTTGVLSLLILRLAYGRKKRVKLALFFYGLISLLMFIDIVYYSQFYTLPSVAQLGQIAYLGDVGESVGELINLKNLSFLLDLPILAYILHKRRGLLGYGSRSRLGLGLGGLVLLGFLFTGLGPDITSQEFYSYHLGDLLGRGQEKSLGQGLAMTQEDLEDLEARRDLAQGNYTGLGQGKNLIVLQVEALQNFVIGLDYQGQEVTPVLNELIGQEASLYYNNYFQLVGRGNTSDAEFVSNNSLHPSMLEPSYERYEKNTFYGLPRLLGDQGYFTVAMHGHDKDFWNRDRAYVNQGFQTFLSVEDYEDYEKLGLGVSDEDFFRQNVAYLADYAEKNQDPFYAFMVSLSSHTPFNMEEEYRQLEIEPRHEDTMFGRYLNSIHYTDRQIGLLVEELRAKGLYENTVLAIYGDHFAVSSASDKDGQVVADYFGRDYNYDHMMNIPLIIHLPGEEVGGTVDSLGSQLDFYPTILNIMGYENKRGLIFGRDLNNYRGENLVAPQTYMKKGSFISEDTVYIMGRDGIFNHGQAYSRTTREEVPLEGLAGLYERAIREINLSNFLLEGDRLGAYIEEGRLDLSQASGPRGDLIRPRDLLPGGDLGARGVLRLDLAKWPQEDLEAALPRLEGRDLVLWSSGQEEEDLIRAYDLLAGLKPRAEIRNFKSYLNLTFNRYETVILDTRPGTYSWEEVREFLSRYPGLGLRIDLEKVSREDYRDLLDRGVDLYS